MWSKAAIPNTALEYWHCALFYWLVKGCTLDSLLRKNGHCILIHRNSFFQDGNAPSTGHEIQFDAYELSDWTPLSTQMNTYRRLRTNKLDQALHHHPQNTNWETFGRSVGKILFILLVKFQRVEQSRCTEAVLAVCGERKWRKWEKWKCELSFWQKVKRKSSM